MKPADIERLLEAFDEPPNVAVFATAEILARTAPGLLVVHDGEDGAWQFLDGDEVTEGRRRIVALRTALQVDPGLASLGDLPLGWFATRSSPAELWHRLPIEQAD